MFTRGYLIAACAVLVALTVHAPLQAGPFRATTYVTFSGSVALPGVTLPAGTYIFERAPSVARNDVVQVLAGDRSRAFLVTFTERTPRPAGLPAHQLITLGEMPAGGAPPVLAWYPIGEKLGHKFIYRGQQR